MKKLSNLMMHNPLLILVIYKLLILTLKSILLATCYNDDSGSGAAKSSRTNEAARDGTKREFKELSLEARGRHAAQNVLTEQSGLFFQQTVSRNRCCKIMRFLRFDLRSTKSARLQTDKFALNSNI